LAGDKADNWWLRHHPKVLGLCFKQGVKRADKSNAIDLYVTDQITDISSFNSLFDSKPELLTVQEKAAWKSQMNGLVVSSDAFFPFFDNIQRVSQSGVEFVAAPGGSVNDQLVIQEAEKLGITLAFTDYRLFHH
jgi:phosphoribosylaminoimidazolecarboxamide formyltransferase/IMP cyclohydrolase